MVATPSEKASRQERSVVSYYCMLAGATSHCCVGSSTVTGSMTSSGWDRRRSSCRLMPQNQEFTYNVRYVVKDTFLHQSIDIPQPVNENVGCESFIWGVNVLGAKVT